MTLLMSGTHRFQCFTAVDPSKVWVALTDGQGASRHLHGLVAESSWCADASIQFRAGPGRGPILVGGRVLFTQPPRRLSYLLKARAEDPSTYVTWQLRPCSGGSIVHLQVDQAECADTKEEAENTWLPVLAALQSLLSRDAPSQPY
jgi:uncharacterized protein YndB with AHSA1/START domain